MATLYDLAMQYLNQSLPKTFEYGKTNQPGIPTPVLPVQPTDPVKKIIPIGSGGGGEGAYNPYNPDPNSISNKNYSPYAYRQAMAKSGAGIPSGILSDSEFLYGKKSPLEGVMSMLPGQQILKGLASKLPVNRRGIFENELAGQGIMVNDIGQIVASPGNINTAENIMAGYNANKITAETFQKRRDMINAKMKDPEQKAAKLKALDEAEAKILGTAKTRTDAVFDMKSLAKDPDYLSFDQRVTKGLLEGDDEDDGEVTYNPLDPLNLNTTTAPGFKNFYNPYERDNIVDVQKTKDAIEEAKLRDLDAMDPGTVVDNSAPPNNNPNEDHDGDGVPNNVEAAGGSYDGGYQGAEGGFEYTGDFGDPYSDDNFMAGDNSSADPTGTGNFSDQVTGNDTSPGATGGEGGSPGGGGGTHCCTAANERGDMTLTEVKKLRAWHRKQSKIWQRGYDVWGRVIADNFVSKDKWSSDRVRDFYNHKIYGKRTIGSTFADFCIYPMSMIIGSILTVMPPILGYQENKRHGKSSS